MAQRRKQSSVDVVQDQKKKQYIQTVHTGDIGHGLADICNSKSADGYILDRIISTGGNESVFLWRRK